GGRRQWRDPAAAVLIEQGDRVPSNLPIDGHSFRRVEVLTGTPRRRRWSDAEKDGIVAESVAPGAKSSEIALRHGLHRNQLYDWRRQFRFSGPSHHTRTSMDESVSDSETLGSRGGRPDRD